jgi:predicted peroxiredoxin
MAKLMINCTHGKEDPERATLAFVVANIAASADQEVVALLTIEGVRIATKGYADGISKEGFQPLKEVLQSFMANGGKVWACGSCTKPRGIGASDLIAGAQIVTAANVVEYLAAGASSISF